MSYSISRVVDGGEVVETMESRRQETRLRLTDPALGEVLHAYRTFDQMERPRHYALKVGADANALICINTGTQLLRTSAESRWYLVAPHSLALVRGPVTIDCQWARGKHDNFVVQWHDATAPRLGEWLRKNWHAIQSERKSWMVGAMIAPKFLTACNRLREALDGPDAAFEPLLWSVIFEVVPGLAMSRNEIGLAPVPPGLPAAIEKLVKRVYEQPDAPWPLKDAADFVGYSPFHFSRYFKQLFTYGFHEFVDRVRTERAVHQLTTTTAPVDAVAATAGFGTTQALRESVKEYLGLVPSELRPGFDDSET